MLYGQARRGEFCGCLSTGILPSLIDAGFVFVVRWALDDPIGNSLAAAVDALHALIVSSDDEVSLFHLINVYHSVYKDIVFVFTETK